MVSPLKRRLNPLIILITILVVSCQLSVVSCFAQSPRHIRVAILENVSSLRLKVRGTYAVIDSATNKVLSQGKNLNTTVAVYSAGILLRNTRSNSNKLLVKSYDNEAIIINGRMFRGEMQFIKNSPTQLSAINYIELEDYIKGISVRETSHYRPAESLKAEVIVFRTFALYKMQENKQKDFDLTSDIYSQVYGGKGAERYRINKAVDETRGLVLTYQAKIILSFYHATCGGYTEDASLLWDIDMLPLKGVPCNFCQDSPHFKWHNVLSQEEVKNILVKAGYGIGNIKEILILGRDKSNRITNLKILTEKKNIEISAKDFRNLLGPNIIKSTNFNVRVVEEDVVFEGFGWGHGVGLCQWGAYFMAKQGYDYKQILEYYYPAAVVSSINNL